MAERNPNRSRRSFIKKTGALSGISFFGGLPITTASACSSPSGNYDEVWNFWYSDKGDQAKSSTCNGGNGTRMDMASTGVYKWSLDAGDGDYIHVFSNHAHAEHYVDSYENGGCVWNHYPGIDNQSWKCNAWVSGNKINAADSSTWIGADPPETTTSDSNILHDLAYTGMSSALSYAWPGASKAMTAAEIVYALLADGSPGSSSLWDEKINWYYGGNSHACASHYNKYTIYGNNDHFDVVCQDSFSNQYFEVTCTHNFKADMYCPDCGSSTSSSLEGDIGNHAYTTAESTQSNSLTELGSVGETVETETGRMAEIISSETVSDSRRGSSPLKMNAAEFRRVEPVIAEQIGTPERILRPPVHSTATTQVKRFIE